MANLRQERLTPGGFEQTPAPRGRRWPWVAGVAVLGLAMLAWFDGGEESLRPIAENLSLPEQGR